MNVKADIPKHLLAKAVNTSNEGIVIIEAQKDGFAQIFVSEGYERLTGHTSAEIVGKNFRVFNADDDHQPELATIHSALTKGKQCVAMMRNYRKDGTMYWNEISISHVHDGDGVLTHFISIQKDVTARIQLEQQLSTLSNTDPATGVGNRGRQPPAFRGAIFQPAVHCQTHPLRIVGIAD